MKAHFTHLVFVILLTTLISAQEISIDFNISDGVGGSRTISVGIDPAATDGIDAGLGEELAPPLPPSGSFEARFNINETQSTYKDYRNGTTPYTGTKIHEIQYQPSSGTNITLSWTLPSGVTGNLKDKLGGIVHNYSFGTGADSYLVANADVLNKLDLTLTYTNALPVELTYFSAMLSENAVKLEWETATEVNNYGFQVQRQKEKVQSESEWEDIGFVQGHGTTNSPKSYSFTDNNLPEVDEVSYRLKQIDNDGTIAYSKIVTVDLTTITSVDDEVIYEFALEQNYPNPFNPTTTIKFTIPSDVKSETSNTMLIVYDILGREVVTLVNQKLHAGNHEVAFNASNLSSGVYFYKLQAGNLVMTRKLLLMK